MINHDGVASQIFNEFDPTLKAYCNVGAAVLGAGFASAASSAYAANKASQAQQNAANTAANTSLSMYNQTRSDLSTYRDIGANAGQQLQNQLPFLTSPITMDQATLEKTPGYQFNKYQGLKAVQNSAAARGLGVSGAALKGAAAYSTGLSDNTYQNQFNNENTNRTNAFNRLASVTQLGENAAAQTGSAGTSAANTAAGAQIGAGNAAAAGINGVGNAVANGVNALPTYFQAKSLYGSEQQASNIYGAAGGYGVPTFG
jgi:hypothetical protein